MPKQIDTIISAIEHPAVTTTAPIVRRATTKYQMLRVEKLSSISALTAAHLFVYFAEFLFQFDD
jgi:hypothetical protein